MSIKYRVDTDTQSSEEVKSGTISENACATDAHLVLISCCFLTRLVAVVATSVWNDSGTFRIIFIAPDLNPPNISSFNHLVQTMPAIIWIMYSNDLYNHI